MSSPSGTHCRPLVTSREMQTFLMHPPWWRTLCIELQPHSPYKVKNEALSSQSLADIKLEHTHTFCHFDPDNDKDVASTRFHESSLPRTLVCHDMANGYADDSPVDGTGNHTAYSFYNWAGIDIFCYFSHHLITIPPVGWINVAHLHGVKCIGTVITEWSEGIDFWEQVLEDEVSMEDFISLLVTICRTLNFDGWLLNIENKVTEPTKLLTFVSRLHRVLHAELPHAELIWYDSVTATGQLNWQNQLNEKNRVFFDACDGLFTNYSWGQTDLEASVAAAGPRLRDLFIGMDVWGRNFHGGGMFNLQEAMKLAYSYGCSVAIFAPAWTREALPGPNDTDELHRIERGDKLSVLEQFRLRDRALWDSIWPFLSTKLPSQLPFRTSFCVGQGKKRRLYGEALCATPWYNLRHQQYQPNAAHGPHGYLLSTYTKIKRASKQAIQKGAGIIKWREELYKVAATTSDYEDVQSDDERATPNPAQLADSLAQLEDEDEPQSDTSSSQRRGGGRLSNAMRQLFSRGSTRAEVSDEPHRDDEDTMTLGDEVRQPSLRLDLQHQQRRRLRLAYLPEELPCVETYFEDSFNGGSCVKLNPSDRVSDSHRFIRLLQCDFVLENILVACVVTKRLPEAPSQYLTLHLTWGAANADAPFSAPGSAQGLAPGSAPGSGTQHAVLICRPLAHEPSRRDQQLTVYPENMLPSFRDLRNYLLINEPNFYIPVQNAFDWNVWYFRVPLLAESPAGTVARISSVNCSTGLCQGAMLLGYIAFCNQHPLVQLQSGSHGSSHLMRTLSRIFDRHKEPRKNESSSTSPASASASTSPSTGAGAGAGAQATSQPPLLATRVPPVGSKDAAAFAPLKTVYAAPEEELTMGAIGATYGAGVGSGAGATYGAGAGAGAVRIPPRLPSPPSPPSRTEQALAEARGDAGLKPPQRRPSLPRRLLAAARNTLRKALRKVGCAGGGK